MSLGAFRQLRCHKAGFIAIGMLLEEVGEEENLENDKDNEQFNQDNRPQRLAEVHIPETVVIEVEDPVKESLLVHRRCQNDVANIHLLFKSSNYFAVFYQHHLKTHLTKALVFPFS